MVKCIICYGNCNIPYHSLGPIWFEQLTCNTTLLGIVRIDDPLQLSIHKIVVDRYRASVTVKMCIGDNVLTAQSIIKKLCAHGEIVGVTGNGMNDSPALKTAHIDFFMDTAGTKVLRRPGHHPHGRQLPLYHESNLMGLACQQDSSKVLAAPDLNQHHDCCYHLHHCGGIHFWSVCPVCWCPAFFLDWYHHGYIHHACVGYIFYIYDSKLDKVGAPLFLVNMYRQIVIHST